MRIKSILVLFLALSIMPNSYAEDKEGSSSNFILRDGVPIFTQTIVWEPVSDVLKYQVIIVNDVGDTIVDAITDEPKYEVQLGSGNYKQKIIAYNLLDQKMAESDWVNLLIKKAVLPVVTYVQPEIIQVDDNNPNIEVGITDYSNECKIMLIKSSELTESLKLGSSNGILLTPLGTTDNGITTELPALDKLADSVWYIKAIHPSGLFSISPKPFSIRTWRAINYYVGLSWLPQIIMADKTYKSIWQKKAHYISFDIDGGVLFYINQFALIGVDVKLGIDTDSIKNADILLSSLRLNTIVSFVYAYPLSRNWLITAKIGGGLFYSFFKFKYTDTPDLAFNSVDPAFAAGIGIRWNFIRYAYAELGINWQQVFYNGFYYGAIVPELTIGFRY